jgi:hypothetical protein
VEFIGGLAHTVLRDASGTLRAILLNWLARQSAGTVASTGALGPAGRR